MANIPNRSRAAFAIPHQRDGDQDILSIGRQCAARSCGLVDFLPITCAHCSEPFCMEHQLPQSHDCKKWDPSVADRRALECPLCSTPIAVPLGEDPNIRMSQHFDNDCVIITGKDAKKSSTPICSRPRCEKRLWQPIECVKCHNKFCAAHRYPEMHSCTSVSEPATASTHQANPFSNLSSQASAKSTAAMAAFKRSLASSNSSTPRSVPRRASAVVVSSNISTGALSASASTPVSAGADKMKSVFSSKDRCVSPFPAHTREFSKRTSLELSSSPSPHATSLTPQSDATVDTDKPRSPTAATSTRCAPNDFTFDTLPIVPRPLFGTA
ncbi:hypothetical protein EW145_g2659 [Phellinidium pouzarii]|uniref:AN1-type domain-containing protein n=1 Tax=Phellinidium pouzarii TaxID=167371 RepID=A0A4S4LA66_9AGAM|nr:hypothetical protein EW145_g2659 [Phellinidium pouzarii]